MTGVRGRNWDEKMFGFLLAQKDQGDCDGETGKRAGAPSVWHVNGRCVHKMTSTGLSAQHNPLSPAPICATPGSRDSQGAGNRARLQQPELLLTAPDRNPAARQPALLGMVNPSTTFLNNMWSLCVLPALSVKYVGSQSLIKASKLTLEKSAGVKSTLYNEVIPWMQPCSNFSECNCVFWFFSFSYRKIQMPQSKWWINNAPEATESVACPRVC